MDTVDSVIALFAGLPDWQSRYRQLIVLGDQLPPFPADAKTPEYLVSGCESKVWLYHQQTGDIHRFCLDSEAKIIRGLLAILLAPIQGQRTAFIAQFDCSAYLQQLELAQHLSHSRSNGLQKIWHAIQTKITITRFPQ